ncbi:hypothetical protein COCNU_04G005860 [Cocos nucifera]|uniref:Uncharacterized protein n=1 Tax=Cocos nucifera TaxID=13894 RepID=A0A8K0I5I3_COCNU|nr:hypothetical protein COCNU_04G005860 [Cocos nucifera]
MVDSGYEWMAVTGSVSLTMDARWDARKRKKKHKSRISREIIKCEQSRGRYVTSLSLSLSLWLSLYEISRHGERETRAKGGTRETGSALQEENESTVEDEIEEPFTDCNV